MNPLSLTSIKRLLAGLLLVAPFWAGCDSDSDGDPQTDTYNLTLSDEGGTAVLGGELRLIIEEGQNGPGDVTGSWELTGRNGQPDPMATSGSVSGELLATDILIRLNMDVSDSGIELEGVYSADEIIGAVVVYILVANWIGFIPVAFALLMGLFLWFRVRPLNALIIAALFTAVTFWFFAYMLRVPLPRGWLTGIV